MDIKKEYERWLANATADADVAAELKTLDDAKIEDAFYRDLDFGTGGLRGVIGAGTNRMNIYTVAKASQGLADYLKKNFAEPSVAIGYDSRIKSDVFSKVAAGVFAANGGEYLACSDAGAYRVLCDPLSAYLCGCHGHRFPQPRQIQRLQGLRRRWLPDYDRGSCRNSG